MQLAKVYERAALAIQTAMEQPGIAPAVLLKLSRELRTLLKEARSVADVPVQKDERMAELARKRHAMRAVSCGVDAGTHAEAVRQRCGDACETDARMHAESMRDRCEDACETDAAKPAESMREPCEGSAGVDAKPSTYSTSTQSTLSTEVLSTSLVKLGTTSTRTVQNNNKGKEGYGGKGDANCASDDACENACESDAAPHAEVDAPKPAKRPRNLPPPERPSEVDPSTWADWLTLRRTKKAPVTATVIATFRSEASKAGLSLSEAMQMACAQGWQGFRAEWATKVAGTAIVAPRAGYGGFVPKALPVGSYLAEGESPIQPF